jgi:outer membrane protein TolC
MHPKTTSFLALAVALTLAGCGQKAPADTTASAPAATSASAVAATPAAAPGGPAPAAASSLPKPEELVTPAEAASLLGAEATLEVHNMQAAYPGSVDFAYQTKKIQILSAAFYPQGGAEMFENMKKSLSAPGSRPLLPCSVGDSCFKTGEGMVHVLKGGTYFTLSWETAGAGKLEELGKTVVGRIP